MFWKKKKWSGKINVSLDAIKDTIIHAGIEFDYWIAGEIVKITVWIHWEDGNKCDCFDFPSEDFDTILNDFKILKKLIEKRRNNKWKNLEENRL